MAVATLLYSNIFCMYAVCMYVSIRPQAKDFLDFKNLRGLRLCTKVKYARMLLRALKVSKDLTYG